MTKNDLVRSILVPVDFSAHSEAALLFAAQCAAKMGSAITVLHVIHDPGDAPGYYSIKGRKKQLRRLEDVATESLETMMVKGLPVNRILEVAKKSESQMIVMGSQGRTGLKHIMLGSKAEQIARLSPVPVTIVKQ